MPILRALLSLILMLSLAAMVGVAAILYYFTNDLPDYSQLENYAPPVVTRIYAGDGRLLEEYARERRIFTPISAIPKPVIEAFLAAEDRNFYTHPGVDLMSVVRAGLQNVLNMGQGRNMIGGSTITQQVVKNFLLTNERTMTRKIKEALLAYRISEVYTKDQILELYLNEIYLGGRSYGVAAAALHYFNKALDELSLEEAALLAALPKAPSAFDPRRNYGRAEARRNWVLNGMAEEGYVTLEQAEAAARQPIILKTRTEEERVNAAFFAEEIRRELVRQYGESKVYEGGLTIYSTVNPDYQNMAAHALREALEEYDRRHGWRGALKNIDGVENWMTAIVEADVPDVPNPDWKLAVVLKLKPAEAEIGFSDGARGTITLEDVKWARKPAKDQRIGAEVKKMADVFKRGDLIWVMKAEKGKDKDKEKGGLYSLRQVPEVSGAIVVQDVQTGRILAMQGGYTFEKSQFNRATQALRQPGSAFKPFAYLAAIERGYTPATLVRDEPIELYWGAGENLKTWTPKNYSNDYLGPTTLRRGLELSRNVMTVRLAIDIGISRVTGVAKRFGINDKAERNFSTVLGATETTLLRLTNAYAMLANGGHKVTPKLIDRIQDRNGQTIYRSDDRPCEGCNFLTRNDPPSHQPPQLTEVGEQVTDPVSAYLVTNMLEGVVKRGTAAKAASLGLPLAGKTGTTNNAYDAWFMGFTPEIAVGVYIGFDSPRTLGLKETGSSVALPAFIDFIRDATKGKTVPLFRVPPGVRMTRIDYYTGYLPTANTPKKDIIWEAFRSANVPTKAVEWNDLFDPAKTPLSEAAPVPIDENTEAPSDAEGTRRKLDETPATLGTGGFY